MLYFVHASGTVEDGRSSRECGSTTGMQGETCDNV